MVLHIVIGHGILSSIPTFTFSTEWEAESSFSYLLPLGCHLEEPYSIQNKTVSLSTWVTFLPQWLKYLVLKNLFLEAFKTVSQGHAFILLHRWLRLYCVYIGTSFSLFLCWWASRLFSYLGHYDEFSSDQEWSHMSTVNRLGLPWNTETWNHWILWKFYH